MNTRSCFLLFTMSKTRIKRPSASFYMEDTAPARDNNQCCLYVLGERLCYTPCHPPGCCLKVKVWRAKNCGQEPSSSPATFQLSPVLQSQSQALHPALCPGTAWSLSSLVRINSTVLSQHRFWIRLSEEVSWPILSTDKQIF